MNYGCSANAASPAGPLSTWCWGPGFSGSCSCCRCTTKASRGRSPLVTGLLLAPQGLDAALTISLAGYLTDRVGARRVVLFGVALALAGTAWYTQVGARSSYGVLAMALFLIGVGMGATVTPAMAAAFQGLPHSALGHASSAINVVQRIAGAAGSALLAVVLQQALRHRFGGFNGGVGQVGALAASSTHAAASFAGAGGVSFAVALGSRAAALVPTLLLPGRRAAARSEPAEPATLRQSRTMVSPGRIARERGTSPTGVSIITEGRT